MRTKSADKQASDLPKSLFLQLVCVFPHTLALLSRGGAEDMTAEACMTPLQHVSG